jgi:hypothetical protein
LGVDNGVGGAAAPAVGRHAVPAEFDDDPAAEPASTAGRPVSAPATSTPAIPLVARLAAAAAHQIAAASPAAADTP